jgi:hypothetical protein
MIRTRIIEWYILDVTHPRPNESYPKMKSAGRTVMKKVWTTLKCFVRIAAPHDGRTASYTGHGNEFRLKGKLEEMTGCDQPFNFRGVEDSALDYCFFICRKSRGYDRLTTDLQHRVSIFLYPLSFEYRSWKTPSKKSQHG